MAEKKIKTEAKKKPTVKRAPKKVKKESEAEVIVSSSTEPVIAVEEAADNTTKKKSEYLYGIGRRKTAIAQVRVYKKGDGKVMINDKDMQNVFAGAELQDKILSPLKIVGQTDKLDIAAKVQGGGRIAQTEAIRHGISRALLQLNPNFKKPLKKAGFLTRDPRKKERKKPGLKRARKAPQWTKR